MKQIFMYKSIFFSKKDILETISEQKWTEQETFWI